MYVYVQMLCLDVFIRSESGADLLVQFRVNPADHCSGYPVLTKAATLTRNALTSMELKSLTVIL